MSAPRSYRWPISVLLAGLFLIPVGNMLIRGARAADKLPPVVRQTTEEDHKRMMDLLHITELRKGKNGTNKADPTFANYDESKANPYPDLPDPLKLKNGKMVTTAEEWWSKRRPEIVEDFDREVYGRVPKNTPKVNWHTLSLGRSKSGDVDIVTRQLEGVVDNSSYPDIEVKISLTLVTPANAKGPVPVIMQFGGGFGAPGGGRGAAPTGPPYGPNAFAAPLGVLVRLALLVQARGAERREPLARGQVVARLARRGPVVELRALERQALERQERRRVEQPVRVVLPAGAVRLGQVEVPRARAGSNRCWPRAGDTPLSIQEASRPITAPV